MIKNIRSKIAALIVGKSWRQLWAAGLDGAQRTAGLGLPYKESPWVFRAVQLVAAPISALPLKFSLGRDEAPADAERDAFWSRPAMSRGGRMSSSEFFEASAAWLQLEGECFWIMDDTWLGRGASRAPLILARPDRMRHVVRGGELIAWEYVDGSGRRHTLLPQDVAQVKAFNPYCEFRGLAALDCARVAADADYASALFSKHLAQSNGDRGVYVIAKDGQIQEDQQKQIEARIREKRELNQRGIYKSLFLAGDITIEDPKIQVADAAFIASRAENRKEIFIAFGVPPSMCDKAESYSVGAASDRFRLREDTCLPLSAKLMEAVELVEKRRGGRELRAVQDWSLDPVMQQARNERFKEAAGVWRCGVPWSVLNDAFSLGLGEFAGRDSAWLPLNLQEVGVETVDVGVIVPEPTPALEEPAATKITRSASAIEALLLRATREPEEPTTPPADPKREARWKYHIAARTKSEKSFINQLRKALMEARRETLTNLANAEKSATVRVPGVLDIIFDLVKFQARMVALSASEARAAFEDADALFTEDNSLEEDPWLTPDPLVLEAIAAREPFIKDASVEIRDAVATQIEEAITAGESITQMADRIRAAFNAADKERAVTIARTETGIAYGISHQTAIKDRGFEFKEWLSARDEKVRLSHSHADGTIVPADETFTIGEAEMQHPSDPTAPAAEVINCRCCLLASRGPAT